ncbi:hypothetical protein A0H81_12253 [Grifola frondosa]|uniref:F-box domain-containing protein n=1 Tax=Grifola frondosa TaxID=5627 RepID=A0A1C7LYE8_GRIFR|nr:hypothetical protein A0H81_12253 [Grifola frondosa]
MLIGFECSPVMNPEEFIVAQYWDGLDEIGLSSCRGAKTAKELLEAVDAKKRDYERAICSLNDSITRLHRFRNTVVSVYRLPPELLVEIFWNLAQTFNNKNIIAVSHVCQRWRTIAVDSAKLWSFVSMNSTPQVTEFFRRSHPVLVHVSIWRYIEDGTLVSGIVEVLEPHISRLRSVHITMSTAVEIQYIMNNLDCSVLQEISLRLDTYLVSGSEIVFRSPLPALRSLTLARINVSCMKKNCPRNLVHFELISQPGESMPHPWTLLRIFEQNQALETVKVQALSPDLSNAPTGSSFSQKVELPHLSLLSVQNVLQRDMRTLLALLSLPANLRMQLSIFVHDDFVSEPLFSKDTTSLPSLADLRVLEVLQSHKQPESEPANPKEPNVLIRGQRPGEALFGEPDFTLGLIEAKQSCVPALRGWFDLSHIELLVLSGWKLHTDMDDWIRLMGELWKLQTLRLVDIREETLIELLRALSVSRPPNLGELHDVMICPELSRLEVASMKLGDFGAFELMKWVMYRSSCGARLQSLELLGVRGSMWQDSLKHLNPYCDKVYVNE